MERTRFLKPHDASMTANAQSEAQAATRPPHRPHRLHGLGQNAPSARSLAARLGWRFLDVDDVIEAEAGMTIAEIFARHGEAAFREREHATIARLASNRALVLALGGGAIEDPATRDSAAHRPRHAAGSS